MNFAPRFAIALKTGKEAQFSAAWGLYHQTPQSEYLKLYTNLDFEKAMHYILSYQYGKVTERLFRAEAYYKTYNDYNGLFKKHYLVYNVNKYKYR